jgi:hypothetical protein
MVSNIDSQGPNPADLPEGPSSRKRARCRKVEMTITRDSRCMVDVEIEWLGGELVPGQGKATDTPEGRMLAGAAAALQAVSRVTKGDLALELRGTKLVRAFDNSIIIVALRAQRRGHRYDLIGSAVAPRDDVVRGAVLAVLAGTNRILEPQTPFPESTLDPNEQTTAE